MAKSSYIMKNPQILDLYSDYLISTFHLATATGLSDMLNNALSHDQISRFLGQGEFDQKDYWKCIKSIVRQIESPEGLIKIDDTIEAKPYSQENDIICWHYDHSKKGRDKNVKGINIINFLYQNPRFESPNDNGQDANTLAIPLAFEIVQKTEQWFDKKTKKVKRRSPISKHEMVRRRLRILHQLNKVQFKYVLWDTWFSSAENFNFTHYELKKYFVAALKGNRLAALSEQDKREGKFQRVEALSIQKGQALPVWLKGMDFPIRLTKQIFQHTDGSQGELYVVTNDLYLDFDAITTTYAERWDVEVLHKSLKQNVGLEKSPTKLEVTQRNHIFATMIAWVKLEVLSKMRQTNHFALKAQLHLKAIQTCFDCLQQMKRQQLTLEAANAEPISLLK